jgi:phage terminase large subunit
MTQFEIGELYPKQKEFCLATNKYICYGGARGGGKSYVSRIKMSLLALYYPGIQILLLRRTLKELKENHVFQLQKLLNTNDKNSENRIADYKESTKEFIFPNGSRIVLGYCESEKDVLQYQGQAYEVIVLEEATHFTEFQFQTFTESNRMSGNMKFDFNPRMYFTCNPGGVGHAWVKRLFIDKDYKGTENPKDYKFIPSLVFENKYIMEHDPEYVKTLENLPEDRKKAMLYGNWDVFDGQFFPEFDRNIHVIEPFKIPNEWDKYITMDYGLDMFAVLFIAIDTNGTGYVYKEIYQSNLIISEACAKLKEHLDKVKYRYAPPDLWNRNRDTGKSAYEIFNENGIKLCKSSNDRKNGWLDVKEWLKVNKVRDEQTGELKNITSLQIFNNCTNLIRCLPQLQHDDKDPNDVATEPHEITHITDALRYFCVKHISPSKIIKKEPAFHINFESERPKKKDYGEEIQVI